MRMASSLGVAFVAAILLLPATAAMTAQTAMAAGGLVSARDATVLAKPGTVGLDVQGSLSAGHWVLVDDSVVNTVPTPGQPGSLYGGEADRTTEEGELAGGTLQPVRFGDEATLIVVLRDGGAALTAVTGSYGVSPVDSRLLEESHSTSANNLGTPDYQYYAYSVSHVVQWGADASADVAIEGPFELYAWDIDIEFHSADGKTTSWTTGQKVEKNPDTAGLTEDKHRRYLQVSVEQGTLALATTGGVLEVFASQIETGTTAQMEFRGSEGDVDGGDGKFQAQGPVAANGGSYRLSYQDGRIDVGVLREPKSVVGPQVTYVPDPLHERPWFAPVVLAAVLAACILLTAYGYPSLRGLSHLRTMESLTGTPRPQGWRKVRAEGFAYMAANAEDGGHVRMAARFMLLATRLDPHDPEKALDAGVFLQAAGRPRQALAFHQAAHAAFLAAGDRDNMAHNAYEAAKAVAGLGTPAHALDWLRIALEADPSLVHEVGSEPRFHGLRDEPDYASMTSAGAA